MTHAQRNDAIKKLLAARTAEMLVSPAAARKILIGEGIYTQKGTLRVEYGGPGKKPKAAV